MADRRERRVERAEVDAVTVAPAAPQRKVLKEWNEPRHAQFELRTAWSMLNASTEALKKR